MELYFISRPAMTTHGWERCLVPGACSTFARSIPRALPAHRRPMHHALGAALLSASLLAHASATVRATHFARCYAAHQAATRGCAGFDVPWLRRDHGAHCGGDARGRRARSPTCTVATPPVQVNAAAVGYSAGRVAAYNTLGGALCASIVRRHSHAPG